MLTKAGLLVLVACATLAVRRLLPARLRPNGAVAPLAAAGAAFAAVRIAADSGFAEWLDHDVFERIGGETDDFPTWLTALVVAGVVLVVAKRLRR